MKYYKLLWMSAFYLGLLSSCTFDEVNNIENIQEYDEYAATHRADRIVLVPGEDASTSVLLNYRTNTLTDFTQVELTKAVAAPVIGKAKIISGHHQYFLTESRPANYHKVVFDQLEPATTYAYRIITQTGAGEWFQFTTANNKVAPFSFIYLGDIQNSIRDKASRAMRMAFKYAENPALIVTAGDLVASREEETHDNEWAQWWSTGSFVFAETPQIVAAGNHEYIDHLDAEGNESKQLVPHWNYLFNLPNNGVKALSTTNYKIHFQGVDFFVLDGTAAIELNQLNSQAEWLKQALNNSTANWKIVVMHQPIFTCARPTDTEQLKAAWMPIIEKYKVALVLQGHDHCYSRYQAQEDGATYYVSVTGSKMYGLNDRAPHHSQFGEDTQFFQLIDVANNSLSIKTYTAIGELYDHAVISKHENGFNLETLEKASARFCEGTQGPDDFTCSARSK